MKVMEKLKNKQVNNVPQMNALMDHDWKKFKFHNNFLGHDYQQ